MDKDVPRTGRTNPYFALDVEGLSPHLKQLRNILLSYCMYNMDLGYCRGMSDLAAPILAVMQNEVDAFWCFKALMDRMQANFHTVSCFTALPPPPCPPRRILLCDPCCNKFLFISTRRQR